MQANAELQNVIKAQINFMLSQQARPRYGFVPRFNPHNDTVRVTIQPKTGLSGWLPVLTHWLGTGWGLCCPPSLGGQVGLQTRTHTQGMDSAGDAEAPTNAPASGS